MKKITLVIFVASFFACNEKPKPVENTTNQVDTTSTRNISMGLSTDSLVITVDSTGSITMGDQKIKLENLETELIDTLQAVKKKYGRLPDTVLCRTKGDVLMGTRGAIKDAIIDAKEQAKQ